MKPRGPRLIQPATSLADAIDLVSDLTSAGVAFRSLAEHIDTSPRLGGRLVVGALAALAELPLSPTHHGRRVRSMTPLRVKAARLMLEAVDPVTGKRLHSGADVAAALGVSRSSLHRAVGPRGRLGSEG